MIPGTPGASRGLTSAEARKRLAETGPNALPVVRAESLLRRFTRQFASPLILILLVALLVDLAAWIGAGADGLPIESLAIGAILLLNALLGVWQERKAEAALARLEALGTPQAWTWRDGVLQLIPSPDLVPGDVIRIEAGDRIPADGNISVSADIAIDESVVTGESLPVTRRQHDPVLAGTLVVRGGGEVTITGTGPTSTLGRLATLLGGIRHEPTPLEHRLAAFGVRLARWVSILALVIASIGLLLQGTERLATVMFFAVALAVAAVPEGLPAVLTLTLTVGVERMAKRKALVRRLAAVEALGSVTVIATDKTGTLTENRLEVSSLASAAPERAIRAMVLASEADPDGPSGDPLEHALFRFARARDLDPGRLRREHHVVSGRPFDSAWKFVRRTVREGNETISYVKGAPEVILAASRLDAGARDAINAELLAQAATGHRLLALAAGPGERESELDWLGFVALWDPPRAEVPAAVVRARSAGIRVVMITGDHPETALTVARSVGIIAERVATGAELDQLGPAERDRRIAGTHVFARVSPEHKLAIVTSLQAQGEVVAMTGDGVNDAPALKRADVGVAMGLRGSDVAREVADLVLLDDNFATIVTAVEEGRNIYENIGKFVRFLLATNLSEVLLVTAAALGAVVLGLTDADGGLLLALTAVQLLWINLVTDGLPALALGLDRTPGTMSRPPRDPAAPLLDQASLRFVLLTGATTALVGGALLIVLPRLAGESLDSARAAIFLYTGVAPLLFTYAARHTDLSPERNTFVHVAVAVSIALQLFVVFSPRLHRIFETSPLSGTGWRVTAVAVLVAWALAELASRFIWPPSKGAPAR